mmetsp:Transcript_24355/g.82116  ORF Transcript_24355/g.82116 Transcript_24355/m.82116 type:complete len:285 (+) Transcript_24355:189-1043(+)
MARAGSVDGLARRRRYRDDPRSARQGPGFRGWAFKAAAAVGTAAAAGVGECGGGCVWLRLPGIRRGAHPAPLDGGQVRGARSTRRRRPQIGPRHRRRGGAGSGQASFGKKRSGEASCVGPRGRDGPRRRGPPDLQFALQTAQNRSRPPRQASTAAAERSPAALGRGRRGSRDRHRRPRAQAASASTPALAAAAPAAARRFRSTVDRATVDRAVRAPARGAFRTVDHAVPARGAAVRAPARRAAAARRCFADLLGDAVFASRLARGIAAAGAPLPGRGRGRGADF